jgi:hypothetical protein
MNPLIEKAINIAKVAHRNQKRWNGNPYIEHLLRLVEKATSDKAKIVAALHDVVEDTSVTLEDIALAGFSTEIVEAVDAITQRPEESYVDYILRLVNNDLATEVKLLDLEDNTKDLKKGSMRDKYMLVKEYITLKRAFDDYRKQVTYDSLERDFIN